VLFCKTIFSGTQSAQLEFLNSQPYYASEKTVIQLSDFPVRCTGWYAVPARTVTKKALA